MSTDKLIAIVDRIEEKSAVLELVESRFLFNFPLELLPENTHEGAALELSFELRPDIEEERRKKIRNLQDKLIRRSSDD